MLLVICLESKNLVTEADDMTVSECSPSSGDDGSRPPTLGRPQAIMLPPFALYMRIEGEPTVQDVSQLEELMPSTLGTAVSRARRRIGGFGRREGLGEEVKQVSPGTRRGVLCCAQKGLAVREIVKLSLHHRKTMAGDSLLILTIVPDTKPKELTAGVVRLTLFDLGSSLRGYDHLQGISLRRHVICYDSALGVEKVLLL